MEGIEQIVSVPVITALVYVAMLIYKNFASDREPYLRLIPSLAVILGVVIGGLAYFIAPELIPATNVFTALLIGASSGLAATGTHQVIKQLQKAYDLDESCDSLDMAQNKESNDPAKLDEEAIKESDKNYEEEVYDQYCTSKADQDYDCEEEIYDPDYEIEEEFYASDFGFEEEPFDSE